MIKYNLNASYLGLILMLFSIPVNSQWINVASIDFNGPIKELKTDIVNDKLVLAAQSQSDLGILNAVEFDGSKVIPYSTININQLETSPQGAFRIDEFELTNGHMFGSEPNLLIKSSDILGENVLHKFYGIPEFGNGHSYEKCNWNHAGMITYNADSIRWLSNDLVLAYGSTAKLLTVKYHSRIKGKIIGVSSFMKLKNNENEELLTATKVDNFIGFKDELGEEVIIVSRFVKATGELRTTAVGDEDMSPFKSLEDHYVLPAGVLPRSIKLEPWSNVALSYVDKQSRKFFAHRYGSMTKYNLIGNRWASTTNAPEISKGPWDFEPVADNREAVLVHVDQGGYPLARFPKAHKDPQSGESYQWPTSHSGLIELKKATLISISSGWVGTKFRLYVSLVFEDNPSKIEIYELHNHSGEVSLDYALQTKHLYGQLVKENPEAPKYEHVKVLAQVSETLGEFQQAVFYYQICLDQLNQAYDPDEYSYVNAHLITCKFLLASLNDSPQNSQAAAKKSDYTDPPSNSIKSSLAPEIVSNSKQSTSWLKELALKIQTDPKIKNSVEGAKKINQALAMINQWQDEIIPREGFEFIDEQLGILSNLIALIEGNELSIQFDGGNISFGDPRFSELLGNVESIKQLEALEGTEFTAEELQAVALQEVQIDENVSFSTDVNSAKLSGYYKVVDASDSRNNVYKNHGEWVSQEQTENGIPAYSSKMGLFKYTFTENSFTQEWTLEGKRKAYVHQSNFGGCNCKVSIGPEYTKTVSFVSGSYNPSTNTIVSEKGTSQFESKSGPVSVLSLSKQFRSLSCDLCKSSGEQVLKDSNSIPTGHSTKITILSNNKIKLSNGNNWTILQKVREL